MVTAELKENVIKSLENADEKLLKLIKALIETYEKEEISGSILSKEQNEEIDKRRKDYLHDPDKSYSWKEVKDSARKASKE